MESFSFPRMSNSHSSRFPYSNRGLRDERPSAESASQERHSAQWRKYKFVQGDRSSSVRTDRPAEGGPKMATFMDTVKAIITRLMFALHGFFAIFKVVTMKDDPWFWYLAVTLLLLCFEGIFTLTIKETQEWKW